MIPTGTTIGAWTILSPVEQPGEAMYSCRCRCGKIKNVRGQNLLRGHSKSCGCSRRGAGGGNYKGGRISDGRGYIRLLYPEHSNAGSDGYVLEHRKVMSEILGRALANNENVHHINGVRDDNRPENLELWAEDQPSGQRVQDQIQWAFEILSMYAPERLK